MNIFSRATGAFLLAVSLLGSSTIALAQTTTTINPSAQKTTTQTQTQTSVPADAKVPDATRPNDTAKSPDATKQADAKTTQQTAVVTPAKSTKPLSTNEDPAMIGKRNINGGFIGKIAGGTEKEVRQ